MNRYDGRPDRTPKDDPWMTVDPLKTFDPEMQADPSATALPQEGIDETLDAVPITGGTPNGSVTLDDDERSKISQACEKLDSAWQESGDQEPRVEEFVPEDLEMGLRQILTRELVLLDIAANRGTLSAVLS